MERLSKGYAVGVPFSAFGLAVKARKDTPRKGRPQEFPDIQVWQRLATTENTQRIEACGIPLIGLMN